MTVQEIITRADALKPNAVPEAEKIRWLSTIEGYIKHEIADTHEGWENEPASGRTPSLTDTLFVPPPYDGLYVSWIMARIDFTNGEFDSYANVMAMFNSEFSAFADHVNRTMAPRSAQVRYG